ncbi:MAG: SurA N-terminal domain-containing protein [Sphingobium sp.]|nr:SurA N-terminal domain-containing protein [Sphingobium sp.]
MDIFRRISRSKVGKYGALALLLVIGFAFAAGDITGSGGLSVLGPSTATVAQVGSQTITATELQSRVQRFFERAREQKPELTMTEFLSQGSLGQAVEEMVAIKSLIAYGEKHGMRVSKKLIDAEIARIPAFADATGAFSETQFRQVLAQQRVSEKELRDDFAGQIIRQHLLMPATAGARTPESMVPPYAAMLIELREGQMFAVPSQRFAPTRAPSDAELKSYYASHPDDFTLPEQRKIRYVLLSRDRFEAQANPTDAEIATAYKARAADFTARETRDFSQLILPTEAQAKDFAAKAAGGKLLVDLAREAGLSAARLSAASQSTLAGQTSADAAKAAFAASKGKVVGPFKTPLGWALVRVEDVRAIPGKTLEQAKAELLPQLRAEKAKQLFADFVNGIDGKLGEGATLAEIAKANNLQVVETPLITAEGRNLRDATYAADDIVKALVKPAFGMGPSDDPQIVQVKPDEQVAVLAPGDTVAAGPPPLAEVRAAAETGWRLTQGATQARAAATKLSELLNKGVAPEEALKQAGLTGVPQQPLAMRRIELQQQQGRVPPPLRALLTLRVNGAQLVPLEKNLGFTVVRLAKITEEDPRPNAQLMNSTRAGLANVLGGEYALQLTAAIEKDLNVTRNPAAVAAVEKALREANGSGQ